MWPRPPRLIFQPDELYRVPTPDGSAIALGRYHARGPRRFREPVLLAHSLGTNRFNLDFDERYSVARALARRGFETWVLEVRGHGLGGSGSGGTFDTEVEFDVPTALRTVISTGASSVLWVGHSRGGLLAYATLARNPAAPLRAVVTMGAPVTFAAQVGVRRFVDGVSVMVRLPTIPLGVGGRAWPGGLPPDPVGKYLLNAANVDPVVIRQAITQVSADLPGGLARQFSRWVLQDVFDGEDGFDYRQGLEQVATPILAIAGACDLIAPASSVHCVSTMVRGRCELRTAGTAHGLSCDYGHGDLVLGRRAPDEVFPLIVQFLEAHASR